MQIKEIFSRYPWINLFRGSVAWELQLGPVIFYCVHPHARDYVFAHGRRFLIVHDTFWWKIMGYRTRRRFKKLGAFLAESLEHVHF